jgi:hypothetical protein
MAIPSCQAKRGVAGIGNRPAGRVAAAGCGLSHAIHSKTGCERLRPVRPRFPGSAAGIREAPGANNRAGRNGYPRGPVTGNG